MSDAYKIPVDLNTFSLVEKDDFRLFYDLAEHFSRIDCYCDDEFLVPSGLCLACRAKKYLES